MHTGEQQGLGPPWHAKPSSPCPRGELRPSHLPTCPIQEGALGGRPATERDWWGARMAANSWRCCQAAK